MIDEILVHISTPATRQNDDLYRSLADAYLDFEPQEQPEDVAKEPPAGPDHQSTPRLKNNAEPAGSSILSTSRESYGSFPSHISSGGHAPQHNDADTQSAETASLPPSSRLARLDRIHKLWKETTTPRSSSVNGKGSVSQTSRRPAPDTFIEDTQLGAQALQSQLPDSYSSTDEDTSEDEAGPEIPSQLVPPPISDINETGNANTPIRVAETLLPTSKPALSNTSANQRAQPQPSSISKPSPPSTLQLSKKRKPSEPPLEIFDFSKLPVDAFAPAPSISIEQPARLPSQVTKHLAALKTQNPRRFKLSKRHTTPRYDDRGYWRVDTSTWPGNTQKEFWAMLYEYVSSGKLGWGVTLYRNATASTALGQVRLYCWAEIVEHTWLMMWICSKGEIVKSGSDWMGADGSVVFEVAGK